MEKLLELCKQLNIEIEIKFDCNYAGWLFRFSKDYNSEMHHIEYTLTLDDYVNENFNMDKQLDNICHYIEYSFQDVVDTNIESIFKRADVVWRDETNLTGFPGYTRIITSRNLSAPLTEFEKDMVRRMLKYQYYRGHVSFEVGEVSE